MAHTRRSISNESSAVENPSQDHHPIESWTDASFLWRAAIWTCSWATVEAVVILSEGWSSIASITGGTLVFGSIEASTTGGADASPVGGVLSRIHLFLGMLKEKGFPPIICLPCSERTGGFHLLLIAFSLSLFTLLNFCLFASIWCWSIGSLQTLSQTLWPLAPQLKQTSLKLVEAVKEEIPGVLCTCSSYCPLFCAFRYVIKA